MFPDRHGAFHPAQAAMPANRNLFLSAVSSEFEGCRKLLTDKHRSVPLREANPEFP